jgi:signal transduction histidine kinase
MSASLHADVTDLDIRRAFGMILESAPGPFAVTHGPKHTLVQANAAFDLLVGQTYVGRKTPITEVLLPEAINRMQSLLDRALSDNEVVNDKFLGFLTKNESWNCTIWPLSQATGPPAGLLVHVHKSRQASPSFSLQREITERLLLAALKEAESADRAQASIMRLQFLADAGLQLSRSLDPAKTRKAIAGTPMPIPGTWCIVDLTETDGTISRLAMIHPDRAKQAVLNQLARHWRPERGDPFGGYSVQAGSPPVVIVYNVDAALESAAHSPQNLELLRELEIGSLITVPMAIGRRFLGAVTLLSGKPAHSYSFEEIGLVQSLADRNAEALENARQYAEAVLLREHAELETRNKLRFLGNISHELRTPLNAIVGYVDVIAEEIHGPVTAAQQRDLERIRLNQGHLLKLVNELLDFVRAGIPRLNEIIAIPAHSAVAEAVDLLEQTMSQKSLSYVRDADDAAVVALGDPERVRQILTNLLANAIKFTPNGGHISTTCTASGDRVNISVSDNGIGIASNQLEAIFEPFVQVDPERPTDGGVGLGLAISRDLARTMRGDLAVESALGAGACFTLSLPRAHNRHPNRRKR